MRSTLFLLFFLLPGFQANSAVAEEYQECRLKCETAYTDCTNESPATDPDVQAARVASCELKLQLCYPECENLKPAEVAPPASNPNIIRR